jgi:signal peptidase
LAGRLLTGLLGLLVVAVLAATVGPRLLPYRAYAVLSGSMTPTIPVGSVVVDLPAPAGALAVGDVVTFARPDRPSETVTHRVVAVLETASGPAFRTKGDANGTPDDWTVPESATNWRMRLSLPLAGYLLVYLASPLGQLLAVVVPAFLLAAMALQELRAPTPQAQESAA